MITLPGRRACLSHLDRCVPLICHGYSDEDIRCFRQLSMSAYCWFFNADSYHYLAKPRSGLRTSAESSPASYVTQMK